MELYRIEEYSTTGWEQYPKCMKMTKEQATGKLRDLVDLGHNPKQLRVLLDD